MRKLTLTAFGVMLIAPQLLALDTNHKKSVFIDQPTDVCWYQGQQYSEGSLIKQFDMLFACAKKLPRQNNSRLVWVKANASGVPIKLDPERTIRVK
ncbi:hypothetical protein PCIT_b0534 [Pseudoalteromonas citrea]|uniref:DUF1496 domain-containing protein n=2 Tax=Pseudoalteromonas citrea TaxID=43655 RepID=A0AAD4AEK4_9GAMM|nr:DUF1496 domain-containing protein [Pseudoalteromonas citrea]KAF7764514.1 hypothetical protein PCIT_b0534 [Pseudoalteromonas citrea]